MRTPGPLTELLRIGGALAFVIGGTAALVELAPGLPWLAYAVACLVLLLSSTLLFNRDLAARVRGLSRHEHIVELERKGLITREAVSCSRAIYFDDLDTGCGVYLIEVQGKGLLCLFGQYLHEWGPIDDDPEENQARQFPRTRFEMLRWRPRDEVLDLVLAGEVYDPETLAPTPDRVCSLPFRLVDGAYIRGFTFEQARAALA